jgi:hypothetical protein
LYVKFQYATDSDVSLLDTNQLMFKEVKVKVKFTLEQATKAQMGSRGIGLFSL